MGAVKTLALIVLLFIVMGAVLFYEASMIDVEVSGFSFRKSSRGEQLMDVDVVINNRGFLSGKMNITGSRLYIDGKLTAVLYRPVSFRLGSGSVSNVTVTYRVVNVEPIKAMLMRRTAVLNVTVDSELSVSGVTVGLPRQTRVGRITLTG